MNQFSPQDPNLRQHGTYLQDTGLERLYLCLMSHGFATLLQTEYDLLSTYWEGGHDHLKFHLALAMLESLGYVWNDKKSNWSKIC